ncbi:MAG TPA: 30S ribosomal protein S6 [Candidatus Pacebacteria bacterium]|nr:30S ribosomal protein S6 [Candidatus Paceibacterota bacterium]
MSKDISLAHQYELTFLVPPGYTETELDTIKKEVETLVKKHAGKIEKQEDWGKKPLAYKIKKTGKIIEEANYFYFEISFDPAKAQAFERDLYLVTKVLRHLFVIADSNETTVSTMVVPETQN